MTMDQSKPVKHSATLDCLAVLKRISNAFPEKNLQQATLNVYQEELSDIPIELLYRAASLVIRTSRWFPRIAELRRTAEQLSGASQFSKIPGQGVDSLSLEARMLENVYFEQGTFNHNAWEKVANQLERLGRSYQADELRQKLHHIREDELAHQQGEDYPSQEERIRYASWGNGVSQTLG